jgi:outer membrane protein OmpA-like peptidoglycan-associated protein
MKIKFLILAFLLLVSCQSSKNNNQIPTASFSGDYDYEAMEAFLSVLSYEYSKVSKRLKSEGFKDDAERMEKKSTLASKRDARYYDENSFPFMGRKYDEIQLARLFMEKLRGNTLIFNAFPEPLARMQVYYDCMILEFREDAINYNRSFCTNQFDVIQKGFQRTGFTKNIKYEEKKRETVVLYFDLGSAEIKSEYFKSLSDVVKKAKSMENYSLNVVGLADKTSTREVNIQISKQRAENVKNALVRMGLKEEKIKIQYHADELSLVETEKAEKFNRRVLIDLMNE